MRPNRSKARSCSTFMAPASRTSTSANSISTLELSRTSLMRAAPASLPRPTHEEIGPGLGKRERGRPADSRRGADQEDALARKVIFHVHQPHSSYRIASSPSRNPGPGPCAVDQPTRQIALPYCKAILHVESPDGGRSARRFLIVLRHKAHSAICLQFRRFPRHRAVAFARFRHVQMIRAPLRGLLVYHARYRYHASCARPPCGDLVGAGED